MDVAVLDRELARAPHHRCQLGRVVDQVSSGESAEPATQQQHRQREDGENHHHLEQRHAAVMSATSGHLFLGLLQPAAHVVALVGAVVVLAVGTERLDADAGLADARRRALAAVHDVGIAHGSLLSSELACAVRSSILSGHVLLGWFCAQSPYCSLASFFAAIHAIFSFD